MDLKKIFAHKFFWVFAAAAISVLLTGTYFLTFEHAEWYDELKHLTVAKEIKENLVPTYFLDAYYQHPPVFFYAIAILDFALNNIYLSGKTIVIASSLLFFFILFFAIRQISGEKTAIATTVLLGLTKAIWGFYNNIMIESLLLVLLAATIYFYLKSLGSFKRSDFALAGFFLGLSLLTKTTAVLLAIPMFFYYFYFFKEKIFPKQKFLNPDISAIKNVFLLVLVAGLVVFPYNFYKSANGAKPLFEDGSTKVVVTGFLSDGTYGGSPPEYYFTNFFELSSPILGLFFLLGAFFYFTKKPHNFFIFTVFFALPVMSIFSIKSEYFVLPAIPSIVFISVLGMKKISEIASKHAAKIRTIPAWQIFILFILISALAGLSNFPYFMEAKKPFYEADGWQKLKQTDTGDGIIIVSGIPYHMPFLYSGKESFFLDGDNSRLAANMANKSSTAFLECTSADDAKENTYPFLEKTAEISFLEQNLKCGIFRLKKENTPKTIQIVDTQGNPVPFPRVSFIVENASVTKTIGDKKGSTFANLPDGNYKATIERVCYEKTTINLKVLEGQFFTCTNSDCSQKIEKIPIKKINCFFHKYEKTRW